MKSVFKCDFCDYTAEENKTAVHEDGCPYNPKNKTCLTCKNQTHWGVLTLAFYCSLGFNESEHCCFWELYDEF